MAVQPFFASRDPSIAQSIYNLGNAFLGPDARRRDAQDAIDAEVAGAKVRNLDADTGFTGSRTKGQEFTNLSRQRAYEAAIAAGHTPLAAAYAAMSENPDLNSQAVYRTSGQQQKDAVERVNIEGGFANQRNTADNDTRVRIAGLDNEGRFRIAGQDNDTRVRIAEMDNRSKADLAGRTPVIASDGSTVLFAPGDLRLPVPPVAPAERPAPALPPAVPPPATLGSAFAAPQAGAATQPQAPVVEGNTVRIPATPTARQGNELTDDAKRVAFFKSQTDAWNDIGSALASRLEASSIDLDPQVSRGLVDAAMGIAAQNGYRLTANQALDAAMAELGLAPATDDGWLYDTTTLQQGGAEIDNAALIQEIQRRWGNPAMAGSGAPAAPAPAPTPSIVPPATTPAPAPASAQARDYSRPIVAQTQADIEDFKANAPAGSVIIINGQEYTK